MTSRQCFTWNNFTQTKTPKHQKYTGNNKNKYLAKHIPKPHPGIKSTMLWKHPKNTFRPTTIIIHQKWGQDSTWNNCSPFMFVNENLLEAKQARHCFTWNKIYRFTKTKQTKHTYPTFIASRTLSQHPSATKPTVCKLKYLPPHFSFKIKSKISILFHMKHSQCKRAKTRQLFHVKH